MGIFNYFEKFGGVFVWEPSYNTGLLPPRRPEDPVKELALRCLQGTGDLAGLLCIGGAVSGDDKKSTPDRDDSDRSSSGYDQGCPPPSWDRPGPRP